MLNHFLSSLNRLSPKAFPLPTKAKRLSMTALVLILITTSLVIMSSPSNGQSLTGSPANPRACHQLGGLTLVANNA